MAALVADDNPFRMAGEDQAYLRDTKNSAVAERAEQIASAGAGKGTSGGRWEPGADRTGSGGIGPDVPVRNFNNPELPKPTWFADRDYKACICCKDPFTAMKRRHHCRGCGLVFCNPCTPLPKMLLPLHFGHKAPMRCCGTCARSLAPMQAQLFTQYGATPKKMFGRFSR